MTRTFRAPGRVNLIGEHTDYNQGLVLPIALHLATTVETTPLSEPVLEIHSAHYAETRRWPLDAIPRSPARHWSDYAAGVAHQLLDAGYTIAPARLDVHSTVPEGAGLSSSAALEISCALALALDQPIPRLALARLGQRAETEFVGLPCGIMDQFISVFAQPDAALKIDCRTLECRPVPLPPDVSLVAVNSMVKHSLAQSAYRLRVEECSAAARALGADSLRDAAPRDLDRLDEPLRRRARHVVFENQRVEAFAQTVDPETMGRLMTASHRSLQHLYEVSCAELDFLVDAALAIGGVYGARVTGGGFGGCTINLLRAGAEDRFQSEIAAAYYGRFGIRPQFHLCRASPGAGEVRISAP